MGSVVIPKHGGRQRLLTTEQARDARLSMETDVQAAQRLGVSTALLNKLRSGLSYGPLLADELDARAERRKLGYAGRRTNTRPGKRLGGSEPFRLVEHLLTIGPLFPAGAIGGDQDRQEAMDAAYECAHGRLPHDTTPTCGCWPQEITKTNPQEAINGNAHHRTRLERFEDQARHQEDRAAADRPVPA
jgi:hypothetical protein